MEIIRELNRELLDPAFARSAKGFSPEELARCQEVARNYARMEHAIAVLSDIRANRSHIYYGGFARTLGIEASDNEIGSVWEEAVLQRIHPEDLAGKYLQELRFLHFVKHLPKGRRFDFCLVQKLRMRDRFGNWRPVLHRLFYIPTPSDRSLWFALCLYNPLSMPLSTSGMVVDMLTGEIRELENRDDARILSERERQVLALIDGGMTSKEIAERLSISVHTVSRHRQEILNKLQVRNSIEACRIAKELEII